MSKRIAITPNTTKKTSVKENGMMLVTLLTKEP